MKCNICNGKLVSKYELNVYSLYECIKCGFMQFDYSKFKEMNIKARVAKWVKPTNGTIERMKHIEKFIKDKSIIELGSGGAIHQQTLDRLSISYKEFINLDTKYAHEVAKNIGYNVNICDVSNKNELEQYKSKFDIIFAIHVLEHIPNPKEILKLWKTLLREDSIIYVEVPWYENVDLNINKDWLVYEHISYFNKQSFFKLMKSNFKEIQSGEINKSIYFLGTLK